MPSTAVKVSGLAGVLGAMSRLAVEGFQSPLSFQLARQAVGAVPWNAPYDANARAIVDYIRRHVRYTRERPETLVGLEALWALGAGDCDDMAVAVAALGMRLDYRPRWAVGLDGHGQACHVWAQLLSPASGRWLDCDPTPGVPLGKSPTEMTGHGIASVLVSGPLEFG